MADVIERATKGGKPHHPSERESRPSVQQAPVQQLDENIGTSEIKATTGVPETGSSPSGGKRKAATEDRKELLHRVSEDASGKVAQAVRKMRLGANFTEVQLAARMEMSSVGYLRAIERQTKRKTPTGDMKYIKASFEMLCEIAAETGHVVMLKVEKR